MSAREVNARMALSLMWPGETGGAWVISLPVSQFGRGPDAIISFADPTGHLTVSGTIDAVEDWAAALIQETLMIRLRLEEARDGNNDRGGQDDDGRTDGPGYGGSRAR